MTARNHIGCKCPDCFGLAEYMLTLTGSTYGLERRTPVQHAPPPSTKHRHDCICDFCRPRSAEPPTPIRQPWESRPARRRAA